MYIKKITKRNGSTDKKYTYLHLVESIRTENGPRQRLVLNLGKLDIQEVHYKELANSIEGLLTGQESLLTPNEKLSGYASEAVEKILKKQNRTTNTPEKESAPIDIKSVDIHSLNEIKSRSIGAEYICHSFWEKLGINNFLSSQGLSKDQISLAETVVLGRLISPGSELHTYTWATQQSGVYELSGPPVHHYSERSFYRAAEMLYSCKDKLEQHLNIAEKELFSLNESLCLFDLTNTFLEGEAKGNSNAKHGRSKEKRSDCKLLTLALIVDENGFAKYSKLYPGNQAEPTTMQTMISEMSTANPHLINNKTVLMDAGIASEENIQYLKDNGFHYIVVNKGKSPFDAGKLDDVVTIRENKSGEKEMAVISEKRDGETFLLCWSAGRNKKEDAMQSRVESLFLERIAYLQEGLQIKRRMKKYTKIVETIGRLREKYASISKMYDITVFAENNDLNKNVERIEITKRDLKGDAKAENGCYILRTDREDLDDTEIWETYCMLTRVENSFRTLKSSLGLRPLYHQNETSSNAHMFISVIAYHILHSIEYTLKLSGDTRSWEKIRDIMSTHRHILLEYDEYNNAEKIDHHFISKCSLAESSHRDIYKKLGLKPTPTLRT